MIKLKNIAIKAQVSKELRYHIENDISLEEKWIKKWMHSLKTLNRKKIRNKRMTKEQKEKIEKIKKDSEKIWREFAKNQNGMS